MPYQKTFMQGYNAQVAVDAAHQIIVAMCLTNCPTDQEQLPHMLKRLPKKPKVLTADAGYAVGAHAKVLRTSSIDMYIALRQKPQLRAVLMT